MNVYLPTKVAFHLSRRLLTNSLLAVVAISIAVFLYFRYRVAPDLAFGQLQLVDTQGQPASLNQYKGKVFVLNFWASWCPDCLREMPSLADAQEQLRMDGVEFILVTDEDQAKLDRFRSAKNYPFTHYRSTTSHKSNGIHALPCTYIIDRSGKIAYSVMGRTAWNDPKQVERIRQLAR